MFLRVMLIKQSYRIG